VLGLLLGELLPGAVDHGGRGFVGESLVRESRLGAGDVPGEGVDFLLQPDLFSPDVHRARKIEIQRPELRHRRRRAVNLVASHDGRGPGHPEELRKIRGIHWDAIEVNDPISGNPQESGGFEFSSSAHQSEYEELLKQSAGENMRLQIAPASDMPESGSDEGDDEINVDDI